MSAAQYSDNIFVYLFNRFARLSDIVMLGRKKVGNTDHIRRISGYPAFDLCERQTIPHATILNTHCIIITLRNGIQNPDLVAGFKAGGKIGQPQRRMALPGFGFKNG
jgi:hypothetical protein